MYYPVRKIGRWLRMYPCVPIRRARANGALTWIDWFPASLLNRLDLKVDTVRPLRVEVGGGPHPTQGYVHLDFDRSARHLEYVSPVWNLPFEDESVSEVLAVHVLEHVHPYALNKTLMEWHRVLAPGGTASIHVPNARAIFDSFLLAAPSKKWALVNALFGMYGGPDINSPEDIPAEYRSDHQAMFDFDLLEHELIRAGFDSVVQLTDTATDRHTDAWVDLVDRYSLIVEATKPGHAHGSSPEALQPT